MGMDQYLLIPFLVGWTSIYQLFWCSPGLHGFDPFPYGRPAEILVYQGIYTYLGSHSVGVFNRMGSSAEHQPGPFSTQGTSRSSCQGKAPSSKRLCLGSVGFGWIWWTWSCLLRMTWSLLHVLFLFFELDVCINLKLRHPHFIGTVLLFIFSIFLWVRDDASSGGQGCTMAADHEGPGPPSRKQHPLVIQKPRLLRESRSK